MINQSYPLISIITIVKNNAATVERAILSVLGQTYANIEYIIIDGGSTDGTLGVIRTYHSKIAYWVSEPDAGISDAMNKGISASTGVWHLLLHSDDWLEPDGVANLAVWMKEDFDVICGLPLKPGQLMESTG